MTVYFNDADRGPSNTLQIGGVTVSDSWHNLQPATVAGYGLGISGGTGPVYEVDKQYRYLSGEDYPSSQVQSENINFFVDGDITAITIQPEFRIYNAAGELSPDRFGIAILVLSRGLGFYSDDPASLTPVTLLIPGPRFPGENVSEVRMFLGTDEGSEIFSFSAYREQHLAEEQTFQWGFSVLSLDYTPVPEAGTTELLGLGFLGLCCFGWRRAVSRVGHNIYKGNITLAICRACVR